jgi:hypothetical protein
MMTMIRQIKRHSFTFPHEVVDDPSLSLSQKRAILSEWASDSCAIESFPVLRLLPGTNFPVTFSAIMDARSYLDRKYGEEQDEARPENCMIAEFAKRKMQGRDNTAS